MEEWLKRALFDLAGLSAVAGILGFLIRQWITKAVEYRYQAFLEREKAHIEIQKQSAQDLLTKENALYPEMVELVYRIRNVLRIGVFADEFQAVLSGCFRVEHQFAIGMSYDRDGILGAARFRWVSARSAARACRSSASTN